MHTIETSERCENDLSLIVSPGAELEGADLIVEREQCNINLAGAAESGRRQPEDTAV